MSVLCDWQILERCIDGDLVKPYQHSQIQPASMDMRLGPNFIVFDNHGMTAIDLKDVQDSGARKVFKPVSFVLHPGEFILAETMETVTIPIDLMARVEGKSSLGRLGIMVHVTAGFIDPGFHGPITLEIVNLRSVPMVLRPGLPFCQLSFHKMDSEPDKPYEGRYQDATGVEASLYGKQRPE